MSRHWREHQRFVAGRIEVGDAPGPHAWRGWSYRWAPSGEGDCELACRATDAAGNVQPLQPGWNLGGYANNAVQRVAVTVSAAP